MGCEGDDMRKCVECGRMFDPEQDFPDDDFPQEKLCYECFEASVEEFEEKRRERIARENEY